MKVDLPGTCPHCGSDVMVTAYECPHCGTHTQGQFRPCPFCRLDDADNRLLFSFLTARGNLKEMERDLGLSYPTLRSRMDALLARLGVSARLPRETADVTPKPVSEAIADLHAGKISVDEALARLRNERTNEETTLE